MIGLYYPYIHFRDESWLKLAALYWDRMDRIVSSVGITGQEDSDNVKRLIDAQFVRSYLPREVDVKEVSDAFIELVKQHEEELHQYYAIHPRPDSELTYVFVGKLGMELSEY